LFSVKDTVVYEHLERKQEHFDAWKAKPLHGQFSREIED